MRTSPRRTSGPGPVPVLAAKALSETDRARSDADARRRIVAAVESVARRLGNTKAVCRKCYIHPVVVEAYLSGVTIEVTQTRSQARHALSAYERAVVRLIQTRERLRKTA